MAASRLILTVVVVVVVILVILAVIGQEGDDSSRRFLGLRLGGDEKRGRSRERKCSPRDSKCRSCSRSPDARVSIREHGVDIGSDESCDSHSPERRSIFQGPHAKIPRSRSCSRGREHQGWLKFVSRLRDQ